jgi:hypothetical protein
MQVVRNVWRDTNDTKVAGDRGIAREPGVVSSRAGLFLRVR